MGEFNAEELTNAEWAYAKAAEPDEQLFETLARAVRQHSVNFNMQNLTEHGHSRRQASRMHSSSWWWQ